MGKGYHFLGAPGNSLDLLLEAKRCYFLSSNSLGPTWRTIPVSKWLITMVSKSPK